MMSEEKSETIDKTNKIYKNKFYICNNMIIFKNIISNYANYVLENVVRLILHFYSEENGKLWNNFRLGNVDQYINLPMQYH